MKRLPHFFLIIIFFHISLNCLIAQETQEKPAESETQTEEVKIIPFAEITSKSNEDYFLLENIKTNLQSKPEMEIFNEQLHLFIDSLDVLRADSVYQKLDEQDPRIIRGLKQELSLHLKKFDDWTSTLSSRVLEIEEQNTKLLEIIEIWENTRDAGKKEEAPEVVLDKIDLLLAKSDTISTTMSKRYTNVLELQAEISQKQIEINTLIDLLTSTENKLKSNLFVIDSPPIWKIVFSDTDTTDITKQFTETAKVFVRTNLIFVQQNKTRIYIHIFIFILLTVLMGYINWQNKKKSLFDANEKSLQASAFFFSRPVSAGFLLAIFLSIWIYPITTVSFGELLKILLMIPMIRLATGLFNKGTAKRILFLSIIYFFLVLYNNSVGFILLQRIGLLLITLFLLAGIIWRIWPGSEVHKKVLRPWPRILLKFAPLIVILLSISLVSNIIGNVSLASKLAVGVIESLYLLVAIYTAVLVLDGIVIVFVRARRKTASEFLTTYAIQLERRAVKFVRIIAFFLWFQMMLKAFGFFEPFKLWFSDLMANQWEIGQVTISLDSIFDFVVIILVTFIVARFVSLFLGLEVFPRTKLPRGIPGAITLVIRYTIVGLGVFLAISSLGLDMGKLGLMAGALGVGIGFGLQNIIANFISGLILTFERPIQVGDTIQMNEVFGSVKHIGVRSSTVKAFDGSEIIVPNANLISDKVTNWTLSDAKRRVALPVKVAFGNDPRKVIELLVHVANEHEQVHNDPEPFATFNGFGDNFLDFNLYYWVSENIIRVKSDVALGVHDIIKNSGINTPVPERDVNLRGIDDFNLQKVSVKNKNKTKNDGE